MDFSEWLTTVDGAPEALAFSLAYLVVIVWGIGLVILNMPKKK